MGRPEGSLNKSKFITVKLSRLNQVFAPDALIRIDRIYGETLSLEDETDLSELKKERTTERKESAAPITVKKFNFNKK